MLNFLIDFPTTNLEQRDSLIYGIGSSKLSPFPERNTLEKLKLEIGAAFPGMFNLDLTVKFNRTDSLQDLPESEDEKLIFIGLLQNITSASPFIKFQITNWLHQKFLEFVLQPKQIGLDNWKIISKPGKTMLNSKIVSFFIAVFEAVQDYQTLLEVLL